MTDIEFRTLRIRKETYDKMQAMRREFIRRGLNIVPPELMPELSNDSRATITVSLVIDMALNSLNGMVSE